MATKTDGYSGSDLKEVCLEAAYVRVREISLEMAKYKTQADKNNAADQERAPPKQQLKTQTLRSISKEDFDFALGKVKKTGEIATKFFEKTVMGSQGPQLSVS